MNYLKVLKYLIPNTIKKSISYKLRLIVKHFKQPKMLYGYRDSNGQWRSKTRISDTAFMYHQEKIDISDNVFVWHYTILDGTGGLKIGEGTQIGAWVGIFTHSSHIAIRIYGNHYREIPEYEKKGYPIKNVKIGKYVFIGAGAKILPGVTIGDGAIISAGTIVSHDVGDFEIISGNPANVIGDSRALDREYLDDPQLLHWYKQWQKY